VLGGFLAAPASAALIGGGYQLNWDQNVNKTATETTDSRIFKQTLELVYKGFYNPALANEFAFKFEQEVNNEAPDIVRLLPSAILRFKGIHWEGGLGVKETVENTDEAGKDPRRSNSSYLEFFYTPPKRLPDFRGRYNRDSDLQTGTIDTVRQGVTLSSVYAPNDWLAAKGEYARNLNTDNLKPDQDTEDEKFSGTVGLRHMINRKTRFSTEFKAEQTRSATLLPSGGSRDAKEDQTYYWRNALQFRPFRNTTIDGSYDWTLLANMVTDAHTHVTTSRVALAQTIGTPFDFRGDFTRTVTQNLYTQNADDYRTTEDTWNLLFTARFSKQADFVFKYQKKETVEEHDRIVNLDKSSGTNVYGASWLGEFGTWWKAAGSFERTDTFDNSALSKRESKYSLKSLFDFPAIRFALEPTYDITLTDTYVPPPTRWEDSRDFRLRLAWVFFRTRNLEGRIDHTYGRIDKTTFDPTDPGLPEKRVVTRTDATQANATWLNPLPGWKFGFDVTRQASDISGDDLPPDITTSFGPKADLASLPLAFSGSFKYDLKDIGDNSEVLDLKVGWIAPRWDATLTYTFKKTFSAALNEGYTISLTFKYNL